MSKDQKIALWGVIIAAITAVITCVGPVHEWIPLLKSQAEAEEVNADVVAERSEEEPKGEYIHPDLGEIYVSEKIVILDDSKSVGHAREQSSQLDYIRKENKVRLVFDLQDQKSVSESAKGSYFFVSALYFSELGKESIFRPILDNEKLSREDEYEFQFEMHRLLDGGYHVIGWLSPTDAARIESASLGELLDITLSNKPIKSFSMLAALPFAKFSQCKIRDVSFGGGLRAKISDTKFTK